MTLVSSALGQGKLFAEDCGREPPGSFDAPPVPPRWFERLVLPGEAATVRREVPRVAPAGSRALPLPRQRSGALAGKTIYVSAGHGFYWDSTKNLWSAQRGNNNGIVEDLASTETISQFLVPLLLNAGAYVVPIRETDLNTRMAVVDDGSGTPAYVESGPAGTFSASTVKGFGALPATLPTGTNPFELGGTRAMKASVNATASAVFAPNLAADGTYEVYVAYPTEATRVSDAHYVVNHAGGQAHFRVNQQHHGGTWVLLGSFYFRAGRDPAAGSVEVRNDSQQSGDVGLDAVRFGGGMGLISRGTSGISTRPRFEESARYAAQFGGAPTTVYTYTSTDRTDDVGSRSRFAAWHHEAGEDAAYLSWHTNGLDGTLRGTDTYVYGPNPPDGTYNFTGVAGSDVLAKALRAEIVHDIRIGWNQPSWVDMGLHSADFGELNPTHNSEMPAVLMEVAFHDNPTDAAHLKEPGFRHLVSRAVVQGLIKYFATKDGRPVVLPPEPPWGVAALNAGDGNVTVRWKAPATDSQDVVGGAASSYRLHQSRDGLAWDEGVEVATTETTLPLGVGALRFFRVVAQNGGGESFPSETVAVRVGASPPVLIVNAFDRLEAAQAPTEDLTAFNLGTPQRVFIGRMNDGSYLRQHGGAVGAYPVPFDSATADGVGTGGSVQLAPYAVVDWFMGRGHAQGTGPTATEQALLSGHLADGGGVIFSGAGVVAALASGSTQDRAFLAQVLHTAVAGDGGRTVDAVSGQLLDGLSGTTLDDGKQGTYDALDSDGLATVGGTTIATYPGGPSAGVAFPGPGRVVTLGFPFETITDQRRREDVMARLLGYFAVAPATFPDAGEEPDAGPVVLSSMSAEYPRAQGCGCGAGLGGSWAVAALVALAMGRTYARRRRG